MLLKLSSVDSSISNMALDMKGKDEEGLVGILNNLKKNGADVKDVGKALNLAGLNKDLAQTVIKNSELAEVADTVVTGFDAMATASSGLKGKLDTVKKGTSKLGDSIMTKLGTSIKSVGTLLSGLWASHPIAVLTAVAAGVTAAGVGIKKWNDAQNVKSATKSYNEWSDRDENLTSQIESYKQLKEQLDSGVLSAQEEYDIRSQILDIQSQIADTYGWIKNGETLKTFKIEGGGGSGTTTSTMTIERITDADAIFLLGNKAIIEYTWSSIDNVGDSTGIGTATWRVEGNVVSTSQVGQGKNSIDLTEYLRTGTTSILGL